jgi:hypothetical protein
MQPPEEQKQYIDAEASFCPAISPLPVHDFEYSSNSIFVVTPQDAGTAHEYPADA